MQATDKVAIFWDYENCAVPSNTPGYIAVNNIRQLAHKYGSVIAFKAYLELPEQSSPKSATLRSDLQSCGVSLIDCPHNGRKDVADKMMMVDMFAYAIDNPAPATIILISGDRDFMYAVSILSMRRYRVVLLSQSHAVAMLKGQAAEVFEWPASVVPVLEEKGRAGARPSTPPSVDSNKSTPSSVPRAQSTKPPSAPSTPSSPTASRQGRPASESQPAFSLESWKAKQAELGLETPASDTIESPVSSVQSSAPSPSSSPTLQVNNAAEPEQDWPTIAAPSPFSRTGLKADDIVLPVAANSKEGMRVRQRASNSGRSISSPRELAPEVKAPIPQCAAPIPITDGLSSPWEWPSTSSWDSWTSARSSSAIPFSNFAPAYQHPWPTFAFGQVPLFDPNEGSSPCSTPPFSFVPAALASAASASTNAPATPSKPASSAKTAPSSLPKIPSKAATPVSSRTASSTAASLSAAKSPKAKIPAEFHPLVKVLKQQRNEGIHHLSFSSLGSLLLKESAGVYERAGAQTLKQYTTLAAEFGIVRLAEYQDVPGGKDGNQYVSLSTRFC